MSFVSTLELQKFCDFSNTCGGGVFHQNQERKVKKEYCALAAAPVAVGRHVHFMQPARYAPRILSQCM
jgi:hypothetical protein